MRIKLRKAFTSKTVSDKIRFSYFNGVKIIVLGWITIYIYTENGELEREIEIPEEYGHGRIACNKSRHPAYSINYNMAL